MTYENDIELARETITFVPGFETEGHNDFHTYIDPDIPFNGGISATNGEFNMNFIRTFSPIHDHKTDTIPAHTGLNYSQWAENITYFDGLGREVQRIIVSGSPYNSDVIQPIVYDNFGRLKEEHLPYAITQSGPDGPGGYRPDPVNEKIDFYNNYYPADKAYAFSNKEFDNSPLNRVLKQFPPGEVWNEGDGKPIEFSFSTNDASIPVFKVKPNDYLKKDGYYAIGTFYKNITIDENGNENIEYKNKSDQVIAKIVSSTDLPGTTLETYYVYDDYGNLRYVISPNAAEEMKNHADGSIGHISTDTTIQQLCYYYQYDDRQRMVLKKLPGAKPVYYIYNKRDQLVLTQDGNHRAIDNWLFTKYDISNRPIITGKYHHTAYLNRVQMQNTVDSTDVFYEDIGLGFEHGYSNNAFPSLSANNHQIYTVTYYDNYDYINQSSFANRYAFQYDEISFLYPLDTNVKGQITSIKTKILPNSFITLDSELNYLLSVNYYDKYSRLIQTISDNHLGDGNTTGMDIISNKINFTGDILLTKHNHFNGSENIIVKSEFEYDNGKRLKKTKHKINDEGWVTTSEQKYDELGQMNRKYLHGGSDGSLQTINYLYNIRGWLTDMNDITALEDDLFALNLGYTSGFNPQYNGNISSMIWNSSILGNNTYNFNYDGANRLIQAVFSETGYYDTEYTYDKNGNILTLSRQGKLGGTSTYDFIDELTYTFSGNQLQSVTDHGGDNFQNNGFSDNGSFSSCEFLYDNNGNMIADTNKSLSIIEYNYLNLPQKMFINSSGFNQINYLYDATGKKLRKKTLTDFAVEKNMDYVGSFVYEDDELKYLQTDEGRVMVNSDGTFEYQYFLKDHLGNTRVTFNEFGNVIQEDTYYPFGMQMNGLCFETGLDYKNKYLYNGKELQDEFGLEWYDYGARFYDVSIARWNGIDNYSEAFKYSSPYSYALNSPIVAYDVDGQLVVYVNGFRVNAYKKYLGIKFLSQGNYNFKPWNHNQRFYSNDVYNYWNGIDNMFNNKNFFNDNHTMYVDGMYSPHSSGHNRYDRGYQEGLILAKLIISGEISLEESEGIKLVGHSHGGAHATGMADALIKSGLPVECLVLLAPHQPKQFRLKSGLEKSFQFSRPNDKVSSNQDLLAFYENFFVGDSEYGEVDGFKINVLSADGNEDGLGNHSVQTYTDINELEKNDPETYKLLVKTGLISKDN